VDAPVLYVVRFWVSPEGRQQVFDWLDGGHCAEVIAQPGFLFFQRIKLEQTADDGWESYMMLYGLSSREALDAYFADSALHAKFTAQRAPFIHHLRMERAWGRVEVALTPDGHTQPG
jgi:hypothetical protein